MIRQYLPDAFSFKTAWRDARSRYKSLFLYCSGIIAGVAALVAILSFRSDVLLTVEDQARELLGADLEMRSALPYPDGIQTMIDSIGGNQSTSIEFSSMVLYGESGQTRLSQVRAFDGIFPWYGELVTLPREAAYSYQEEHSALVDHSIMVQFGLSVGDSIRVGNRSLPIAGRILEVPGESAAFTLIGPRVFIPKQVVEGTSLLTRGSRVEYKTWFQFPPERDVSELVSSVRPMLRGHQIRTTTVESRKERFAAIVDNLGKFLGMVAFVALLLGGLGVASAIYIYIKRKSGTVATLRCLGVSSRQALHIFTIQVAIIGCTGAILGAILGVLIQSYLPVLFTDFLPFEIVQRISVPVLLTGLSTGVLISLACSLLPLASVNKVPPLLAIRNVEFSPMQHLGMKTKLAGAGLATLIITATLAWMLEGWLFAVVFTAGIYLSVALLLVTANLLVRLIRAFRLKSLPYIWRQGISNLFRPNNQTSILVLTLGMGMLLIGILYLSQEMLLQRIDLQTGGTQPNLAFFDIQTDQNDEILELANEYGATILQNVPIVSMRLSEWRGRPVQEVREDSTLNVRRWALSREYRVTYRDSLTDSETILEGEWIGEADGLGSTVPISADYRILEDLNLTLGDTLTFDIQGIQVETRIASVREVDFQQPQPNFFILFPTGVLEPAPKFFATMLHSDSDENIASLQQAVARQHPNVSAIDVGLVLESVRQFLNKVAMAVRFMAMFTILTGLIVLTSAIAISKYQRIREAVLLRTIGASRNQINGIQFVEYLLIGLLSCMAGVILALFSGWFLAWFYFDLTYIPDLRALLAASLLIIGLTLLTGFLNMRGVLRKKPLEILRIEAE
ncbi:MAG: FtsX-like permease family protein [Balneolaceae bacterium]